MTKFHNYRYMDWFELEHKFRRLRGLFEEQLEVCRDGKEVGSNFYDFIMGESVKSLTPETLIKMVEILADE